MFLEVLHCFLHIWRSSPSANLYWPALGEKDLHQPFQIKIWGGLLGLFCRCAYLTPLVSSYRKVVKMCAFSWSHKIRLVLRTLHLFSSGQCPEAFKVMYLHLILQSQISCWYPCVVCGGLHVPSVEVFICCLCRIRHATYRNMSITSVGALCAILGYIQRAEGPCLAVRGEL